MRALLLILLCSAMAVATAEGVLVEGMAATAGKTLSDARRQAVADALWNASIHHGVSVNSQSRLGAGVLVSDDVILQTSTDFPEFQVIDETVREGVLRLLIKVGTGQRCGKPGGVRIGAVRFPLLRPEQQLSSDIQNFDEDVPNEILYRLSLNKAIVPFRAENHVVYDVSEDATRTTLNPLKRSVVDRVKTVAKHIESDYLLAGVIVDIGYQKVGPWSSAYRRQAEVEVYLFEGATGKLIMQRRFAADAVGDVFFPADVVFGSKRFYDSDYGKAFGWVLDEHAKAILEALNCRTDDDARVVGAMR